MNNVPSNNSNRQKSTIAAKKNKNKKDKPTTAYK